MLGLNTPSMNSNLSEMIVYSRQPRPNSKSAAPAQSRAYNAYGQAAKETFENELQREMAHIAARQGAERLRHQKIMAENKKRLKAQQEMLKKDLDIKKQEEKEILSKYKENKKTAYVKYLKETSKELMKNVKKEENVPHQYEQQYVAAAPPQDDSNYTKKNFTSSIDFLPRNKKQRLVGFIQPGKSVSPSQKQFGQIIEEDENEYYSKNYVSENDPGSNYQDIITQYYLDLERVKQNKDTGVVERQKMLASLNQLSGNNSTRNNKFEYYGNEKTPSFANNANEKNNAPPPVNKNHEKQPNKIKNKDENVERRAYVDSFNFDEEVNRIETAFGETASKEAQKKFLIESNVHGKPVEDPYLKFLEYQNRKQAKPAGARNTQQKHSGSVDSNDRASGINFQSVQNMVEESEQPNKWTPPTRMRSTEPKNEQINRSQEHHEDHYHQQYQNINVNNNFVASLNAGNFPQQDFVKEDASMTKNLPYKTFKLPGALPTIRKEEVVFAADQNRKTEEAEKKKTPPLNMNDKRSLIFKQQSSLPEKTNREGLNSSRANKAKVNLHQKIPPPTYSKPMKRGASVEDEQTQQENYRRLNEEEANLQNEIIDLHLKERAKVRSIEQRHQLNQMRAPPLFPNFPIPENVVKEEELEESLDRLDTTGAKPKANHMAAAYILPTPTYLLSQQPNPQSQVSSSSHFYGQQQPRESPSLGLPVISHPQRFMPQLMQVSSHNLTNQYNKNSATAFQGFPPSSTTSYNGNYIQNPHQQYPFNFNQQYRSVNFNDDASSHASLNMNQSRVSFERFTPNRFGTGQPFQQQQWQKAYGNNGPDEIRESIRDQQVFGKTSLSHLNKETERLLSSTENLKQTNPNDISGSSEYSESVKSIMKGGGGRSTIRDESVGYGTRKQQMKDYQLRKKIAAQQKKEKQTEKVVVEPPPVIEKETVEGGMKVVTNTNLIHLLMNGGGGTEEEEE